jgi:hypothetical protein
LFGNTFDPGSQGATAATTRACRGDTANAILASVGYNFRRLIDANSREALAKEIKEKATSWSVAFVEVEEIDTINIYWAAFSQCGAIEGLGVAPQHLLIDAKRLRCKASCRSRQTNLKAHVLCWTFLFCRRSKTRIAMRP